MGEVWVAAEQRQGRLMNVSLELLGKGQELCRHLETELAAVIMGDDLNALPQELIEHGASKVYLVEDPRLELYQSDAYAKLWAQLIEEQGPELILFGATSLGSDLASRVAAKVKTGLTAHCVDLYIDNGSVPAQLVQVVPGWGGNLMVQIVCQRKPQLVTIGPGVMTRPQREEGRTGETVRINAGISDEDFKTRTLEMVEEASERVPLEEAEVVVCGGWGLASLGGFDLVEELARVVGGVVAGTRPALDKGWIAEDRLIGQSGKTVSPRLFISLGASGAMHFVTGFLNSKFILAVNQDPKAPIFEAADIGIVGDLREVLPCLIEEFRKLRGEGSA